MRAHQRKAKQNAPEPLGVPARSVLPVTRWVCGPGAWEAGAEILLSLPQPLGLVGEAGLLKAFRKSLTDAWLQAGVAIEILAQPDGSDCSQAQIETLLKNARTRGVKSLLGFGGGRMLDLAKATSQAGAWPIATAPTSAATSACGTAVAVINDAEGAFERVLDLEAPPLACLVEDLVLGAAPPRLLAAGLADTLAKCLEWSAVESGASQMDLAQMAAQTCETRGAEALKGLSDARKACWEACLVHSSQVSWAGQAPAAAAHSLANALSRQGLGRGLLHGEAVGLGLLWQEALLAPLGRAKMGPERLKLLLQSWGLPLRLPEGLNLDSLVRDAIRMDETVHLLGIDLSKEAALAALPTEA